MTLGPLEYTVIGFTGKVVLEPLVTALFTLLIASTLRFARQQ